MRVFLAGVIGLAGSSIGCARSTAVPNSSADAGPTPTACTPVASSNLEGVSIALRGPCVFSLAQAENLSIPYSVDIERSIADVVPMPQDAGHCQTAGPSGLIVAESLTGAGQSYCLCDVGLCAPSSAHGSLTPGTHPMEFKWDGRNWHGPSDTSSPKGAPFPVGRYELALRSVGTVSGVRFTVTASMAVVLTP